MDINTQVDGIVQNIIGDITIKIQAQVNDAISQKINDVLDTIDYTTILATKLNQILDAKVSSLPVDQNSINSVLTSRVDKLAVNLESIAHQHAITHVREIIEAQFSALDLKNLFRDALNSSIINGTLEFPTNSIKSSSIYFDQSSISGNNIRGGIITEFGSTGIDDKATNCQLSIFDDVTVIENNLLTRDLTVKGVVNIEGELNVSGALSQHSALFANIVNATSEAVATNSDLFDRYSNFLSNKLRQDGLDLDKITIGGRSAIENNSLGTFITNSNLQKLGELRELQVSGESYLSNTLYTTNKRVGVNTIEPDSALSIWDQEIEIGIGKQNSNSAVIETPRNQKLVLSSNKQNNLILELDGAVSMTKLRLGTSVMTVESEPPSDDRPRGSIVFNSSPSLGGPLGWVSLGDAKWGNFGVID
jgi:hypothetical protein